MIIDYPNKVFTEEPKLHNKYIHPQNFGMGIIKFIFHLYY